MILMKFKMIKFDERMGFHKKKKKKKYYCNRSENFGQLLYFVKFKVVKTDKRLEMIKGNKMNE